MTRHIFSVHRALVVVHALAYCALSLQHLDSPVGLIAHGVIVMAWLLALAKDLASHEGKEEPKD